MSVRFLRLQWSHSGMPADPLAGTGVYCTAGIYEETLVGDIVVPTFRVRIPNPGGLSLLAASSRYATLAENTGSGWSTIATGRMVAIPSDLGGDEIEVTFLCVPEDEDEVLKAAAEEHRVGEIDLEEATSEEIEAAEIYDPLFYPRDDDDPMSVLAGTLEYWRWHPVTNELGRIHMVDAAATRTLPAADGFGEPRISMPEPPRKLVKYKAIATWTQESKGQQTNQILGGIWGIKTYSFDDLASALPAVGSPVGENTGWYVAESHIDEVTTDGVPDVFDVDPETHALGDEHVTTCQVLLQAKTLNIRMRLGWEYQQQREDVLTVEMPAETQPVMGDDREETVDYVDLAALNLDLQTPDWSYEDPDTLEQMSYSVGDRVQANGRVWVCVEAHAATQTFRTWRWVNFSASNPEWEQLWIVAKKMSAISDLGLARYWDTDRGQRSLHHALRRLRRHVVRRAYCLEVEFDCTWGFARTVTTADECVVTHPKLLNGTATGRVVSVQLIHERGGRQIGRIRMRVPVGTGSTPSPVGDVVVDGIRYSLTAPSPRTPVNVAALPTQYPDVHVDHDYSEQKTAALFAPDPVAVIQSIPTQVALRVRPLQEEDLIVRRCLVTCDPVPIPKGIEL